MSLVPLQLIAENAANCTSTVRAGPDIAARLGENAPDRTGPHGISPALLAASKARMDALTDATYSQIPLGSALPPQTWPRYDQGNVLTLGRARNGLKCRSRS